MGFSLQKLNGWTEVLNWAYWLMLELVHGLPHCLYWTSETLSGKHQQTFTLVCKHCKSDKGTVAPGLQLFSVFCCSFKLVKSLQ